METPFGVPLSALSTKLLGTFATGASLRISTANCSSKWGREMRLEPRIRKLEAAGSHQAQARNIVTPCTTILRREDESDEEFIQRLADDPNAMKNTGMTRSEFVETCRRVLAII
jgi:hypothetical protein